MRDEGKFNLRNPEMKEQVEYMSEFHKTQSPEWHERQGKMERQDLRNEALADGPFDKKYREAKQGVTFVDPRDPNSKFDPQGHNRHPSKGEEYNPLKGGGTKIHSDTGLESKPKGNPRTPQGSGPRQRRDFASKTTNIDIEFNAKYSAFYDKLESYYKGEIDTLGWATIIKQHTQKFVHKDPMHKFSRVVNRKNQPMITQQDLDDYKLQLVPDRDYADAIHR